MVHQQFTRAMVKSLSTCLKACGQQTMDPQRIKLCQAFSELKFHDGGMAKLDTMAFTIAQLRKQLEEIDKKTVRLHMDSTVAGAGLFWQGFEAHGE